MVSNSATKTLVRLRTGRDPEELLRELYVEKRHSQDAIAVAIGVHPNTIRNWLLEFGISRDDRSAVTL